jgi:hypothetical protein
VRLLLDQGFPEPPGFTPGAVDRTIEVVPLRDLDAGLTGAPDWYVILRAHEARFDALVTRSWHAPPHSEELWTLVRTHLSIVTWARPVDDPVRAWGQLLAYVPEVRRVIAERGPSIVRLPAPRLAATMLEPADEAFTTLAAERGVEDRWLREEARAGVYRDLAAWGERDRFDALLRG